MKHQAPKLMLKTQDNSEHRVVVLGASNKPQRYSNMAIKLLLQKGYTVIPVHPKIEFIEGLSVVNSLEKIVDPIDTLTLYVGEARSRNLIDAIRSLKPKRVIFNPGSESDELQSMLENENIEVIHGCTLVMLKNNLFND